MVGIGTENGDVSRLWVILSVYHKEEFSLTFEHLKKFDDKTKFSVSVHSPYNYSHTV